jgi:tungstate transport system ATP-binding protein
MSKPLIELTGLQKIYNGRLVLDIPSFTFEPGLVYALVGPNGSGKSTLLRIIAGVIRPSAGSIRNYLTNAQDIAYLPQKPYAFNFSVIKNITMALPSLLPAVTKEEQALKILKEIGIDELGAAKGNRLSGGETQRLSLARLLVQPHQLLLLDEPTSSTDISGNELVENSITRYRKKNDCGLIFATHALSQAERLADHILFFSEGRIIENGPAKELLQNPKTAVFQDFLRFWRY